MDGCTTCDRHTKVKLRDPRLATHDCYSLDLGNKHVVFSAKSGLTS